MTLKAVTHIHSEWSYDGNWELSRIAVFFGKLGYDLVLTTEHDRTFDDRRWEDYQKACREASTTKTLMVPGIEYSDADNTIHILLWGVHEFLGKDQETGNLLQRVNEKNGICVLAHPGRRDAWKQIETSWLPLLNGIELWNRKFDGIAPSQKAIDLIKANNKIVPFVGLDFHQPNQIFPLSMLIDSRGALSAENALQALRKSQCHPMVYGISTSHFADGLLFSLSKTADSVRRALSKIIKR